MRVCSAAVTSLGCNVTTAAHQVVVMRRERELCVLAGHAGRERRAQAMAEAAGVPGKQDRIMARLAEAQDVGACRQRLGQRRAGPDPGHVLDQRHGSLAFLIKRGHSLIMQFGIKIGYSFKNLMQMPQGSQNHI